MSEIVVRADGHWPDDVERILGALPEWFGSESSVRDYVRDSPVVGRVRVQSTEPTGP